MDPHPALRYIGLIIFATLCVLRRATARSCACDRLGLVSGSAMVHRSGIPVGQVRVPDGTNETTQVQTLLEPMDLQDAVVTADAAHTSAPSGSWAVGPGCAVKRGRWSLPRALTGFWKIVFLGRLLAWSRL